MAVLRCGLFVTLRVSVSVRVMITTVTPAKTDEPIEMPFVERLNKPRIR